MLAGEHDRGDAAVALGDDPEPFAGGHDVTRQDPPFVGDGFTVGGCVLGRDLALVTVQVASEQANRVQVVLPQDCKGGGCADDLAGREQQAGWAGWSELCFHKGSPESRTPGPVKAPGVLCLMR